MRLISTLTCMVLAIVVAFSITPATSLSLQPDGDPAVMKGILWNAAADGSLPAPIGSAPGAADSAAPDAGVAADVNFTTWSRIAFQSYRDSNWEIYLARGAGSQPARLTDHYRADLLPRLNRGATKVVFVSDRYGDHYDILVTDTADASLQRLTIDESDESGPVWSPDGQQIAFMSKRFGNWDVFVMKADGSGVARLTTSPADDVQPSWSPDSRRISFVRRGADYSGTIWTMDRNGAGASALTAAMPYTQHPVWSPDGQQIAFDADIDGDIWSEIAVVQAAGSAPRMVYDPNENLVDAYVGSWSPDSRMLLFSRLQYVVYGGQLYLSRSFIDRTTISTPVQVARVIGTGVDLYPDWATMDLQAPTSSMSPLPALTRAGQCVVSWQGQDRGAAGLAGYQVQYRDSASGLWTDWFTQTLATSAAFDGSPGHTYGFRVRAWDNSSNYQSWPGNDQAQASTTLYTWLLSGTVSDVRGRPLPGAEVNISPAPIEGALATSMYGSFSGHLTGDGAHTFDLYRAGYGTSLPTHMDITRDDVSDHVLPPESDALAGGDFEAGDLEDFWTPSGDPLPGIVSQGAHTGQRAAVLGRPPALTQPQSIFPMQYPRVMVDEYGTVHALGFVIPVWGQFDLVYASRALTATWPISPTVLKARIEFGDASTVYDLAPDGTGGAHIVWQEKIPNQGYTRLRYCRVLADNPVCTEEVVVPTPNLSPVWPKVSVDAAGGLHVVFGSSNGRSYYSYRSPAGEWSWRKQIGIGGAMEMALDADDTVHVVWTSLDYYGTTALILYARKPAGGEWSESLEIGRSPPGPYPQIGVSPEGEVHVAWTAFEEGGIYTSMSSGGVWSAPKVMSEPTDVPVALVGIHADAAGTAHLIYATGGGGKGTRFEYLVGGGDRWSRTRQNFGGQLLGRDMAVTPSGVVRLVWSVSAGQYAPMWYVQSDLPSSEQEYSIAQAVAVPSGAGQATLSYFASGLDNSPLVVTVDDGSVISTLEGHARESTGWRHVWLDMSAWAGRTVTVRLTRLQAPGLPYSQIILDDATLGLWQTPVIESVWPLSVEVGAAAAITVHGQNFVCPPSVRAGDSALTDVACLESGTLQATVPAGMGPGTYALWVTNPAGQIGVTSAGLHVGRQTYLPLVR